MTNCPPPDDLQDGFGYLVSQVSRELRDIFASRVAAHGLRFMEWMVLATVYRQGPSRPLEIAEAASLERAMVTRLVDSLEEKGLVERTLNPADRRSLTISLTEAGHAQIRTIKEVAREVNEAYLSCLEEDERVALLRALGTLAAHRRTRCRKARG